MFHFIDRIQTIGICCFVILFAANANLTWAQIESSTAPITAMAYSPDRKQIVEGSTAGVAVYSWPEKVLLNRLETELSHVHDLKFSPQSDLLLIAGGKPGESGVVELWTWPDTHRIKQFSPHDDVVYRVAWTVDGKQFITASFDQRCLVLDRTSGEVLVEFLGHARPVLALDVINEQLAITGGVDQILRVWNWHTGEVVRELNQSLGTIVDLVVVPPVSQPIDTTTGTNQATLQLPVAFSIGSDRTIRMWQPTTGRMVRFVKLATMPHRINWNQSANQIEVFDSQEKLILFDLDLQPLNKSLIEK